LEFDPRLPQAELGLALATEGLQQEAEAAVHFEKYLAAMPDDPETRFHLARIYLALDKNEQALSDLQQVYQANPKLPGLAAALGDVNALLKRLPESERFYREALAATPGEADLHRALGQTLLDEGKLPEAENEFRATLKLDTHSRAAAKGLATSLYLQKRYQETVPLMEALVRSPDVPPGLFFLLATCYDHLQARPQALAAYEKFLELSQGKNPDQEWQARQRAKLLKRELGK
jgi:tetratricopeptide (TPR) repeat protein